MIQDQSAVLRLICESCSHGCCGGFGKAGAEVERQSLSLYDLFTKHLPTPTCTYLLGDIVANSHDGLCLVDPDDSCLNRAFEWGRFPVAHGDNGTSCHGPLKQVRPRCRGFVFSFFLFIGSAYAAGTVQIYR